MIWMALGAAGLGLGVSALLVGGGFIFFSASLPVSGLLLLYAGVVLGFVIGWALVAAECVSQGNPWCVSHTKHCAPSHTKHCHPPVQTHSSCRAVLSSVDAQWL